MPRQIGASLMYVCWIMWGSRAYWWESASPVLCAYISLHFRNRKDDSIELHTAKLGLNAFTNEDVYYNTAGGSRQVQTISWVLVAEASIQRHSWCLWSNQLWPVVVFIVRQFNKRFYLYYSQDSDGQCMMHSTHILVSLKYSTVACGCVHS